MTYFNHISEIVRKLHFIESKHVYVGIPYDNDFLTMVALVQEGGLNDDYSGTDIHAKNYPFLWIPTANAEGRKASEIPNLYVRQKKGADHAAAGYDDPEASYGFVVCFVLKKSVHIPARPFIRQTNIKCHKLWCDKFIHEAWNAAIGNISITDYFDDVTKTIQEALQQTMTDMMTPPNAPLTINRKHKDDPLIDTGHLRDSIKCFVL